MKKHKSILLTISICLIITSIVACVLLCVLLDKDGKPDVIIAKDGNYNLFPDIVKRNDGTLLSVYYSSEGGHAPYKFGDDLGVIRFTIGAKNGKSWDAPQDLINQDKLESWGLGVWYSPLEDQYYYKDGGNTQHYSLNGTTKTYTATLPNDATFAVEARDPNLAKLSDGTLLFTFFTRLPWKSHLGGHTYWTENDSFYTWGRTYIMYSVDNGNSWSAPTEVQCNSLDRNCAKRGNIAVYDDGTMLIPMYGMSTSATDAFARNKWSTANVRGKLVFQDEHNKTNENGTWQWLKEHSTLSVDGKDASVKSVFGYGVTEASFGVASDGKTTFAMLRFHKSQSPGGDILMSKDYGETWTTIANSSPNSQQAGWCLLDNGDFFVTWSQVPTPRPVYGNVFNAELGWDSSSAKVLYKTDKETGDMADPSSVQLDNGKILVIFYDSNIKAIGGVFCSQFSW